MEPLETNPKRRRPVKRDGQLLLGFDRSQARDLLSDASRRECVALLGKMLLAAVKTRTEKKDHER